LQEQLNRVAVIVYTLLFEYDQEQLGA